MKFFVPYVIFRLKTFLNALVANVTGKCVLLTFTTQTLVSFSHVNLCLPEVDRVCIRKRMIRVDDKTNVSLEYILFTVVISAVIDLLLKLNDEIKRDFLSMAHMILMS